MKRRAAHVLRRMRSAGWITQPEEEETLDAPIELTGERRVQNRTPYFVETIKSEVTERWGRSALSFGRLDIHTTLDLGMQRAAERAVAEGLADLDRRMGFPDYHGASREDRERYVQGGLICLDPRTGYIRAVVGGRDIFVSYYNRATTARRQVGSGFKPVVYLAAFASGEVTPVSLFVDEPRTYVIGGRSWAPKNFKNSYLGPTTAAWALVRSANSTAVQVVQRIGPERVAEMGARLGIRSPLGAYPSIALGTSEVSLLDVAAAYGTIANYGIRTEPTFIRSIADREGRALYIHRVSPMPVLDAEDAYVIIRLMENVVDRGTGRAIRALGFEGPAAGKTGTTNENTDAWFVGFTPDLVAAVWVGFDDRTGGHRLIEKGTGRQITGGNGAAPIWAAFMKAVGGDGAPARFRAPAGVREVWVDPLNGTEGAPESPRGQGDPGPIRIALPKGESPNTPEDVARFLEAVEEGSHP